MLAGLEPSSVFFSNQLNTVIPAGEQADIKLTFKPDTIGIYNGILVLKFSPCGASDTVIVKGKKGREYCLKPRIH